MITPYNPDDTVPFYPCVLDIETRQDGSVITIGFAWPEDTMRQYKIFNNWNEFIEFYVELVKRSKDKKKITRIFAHNGGGFDWLSLIQFLNSSNYGSFEKAILVNSKMIGATVSFNGLKNKVKLVDSLCLLQKGLSKITDMFEVEHKKLQLDDILPEQLFNSNRELYYQYLKNDVLGLQEVLYEFWNYIYELDGSIGMLPMTIASLSLKLFRKTLDENIMVTWNKKLKDFERLSYTGGRVEVYETGIHPVVKVHDINSLYPSVMVNNLYPASYKGAWVYSFEPDDFGLFEVNYKQTNTKIPPILRDNQSMEFRYSGKGVYTSVELNKLLSIGGYFDTSKGYLYYDKKNLFHDFVTKWYNRRLQHQKDGNKSLEYICKIILNSLYGKFGQKEFGHSIKPITKEIASQWMSSKVEYIDYGDFGIVKENSHAEHTFSAIASFVTAYARLKLFDYQQMIISSGYKLYYVDTDSVHHNGYPIIETSELGGMKLETSGKGVYLAKKLYALDEKGKTKITAKGIGGATKHLSFNDFENLANGNLDERVISFEVAPSTREVLLHNKQSCKFFTRTRTIRKSSKQTDFVYEK